MLYITYVYCADIKSKGHRNDRYTVSQTTRIFGGESAKRGQAHISLNKPLSYGRTWMVSMLLEVCLERHPNLFNSTEVPRTRRAVHAT